jgi:DNA-directed RNA polymerase subunit L/DNA-directed RNA polymerase alpha subunit
MLKVNKINLKVINKDSSQGNSRLEFKIEGQNIDYIVVNTIRRVILSEIPIYAFGNFNFEKNSSVFHNNYIKLRLINMPVWAIENNVDFLERSQPTNSHGDLDTINEENEEDVNESGTNNINGDNGDEVQLEMDKNLNSSTLKQLTMYINIKNKTNEIITVTTNDAKFYYGEKQITSPYPTPIPIVKLQPNQEIAFSAITKLGTEEEHVMYSPVCGCIHKKVSDTNYDVCIESRGQLSEKRIIQVALINIERRIRNFLKLLNDNKPNKSDDPINSKDPININTDTGIIIVNNEDHTLGNLISRGMQLHDAVSFAGYNLPHPLGKKVHFHYKLKTNRDIKLVIKDVVEYYSDIFANIKKSIDLF